MAIRGSAIWTRRTAVALAVVVPASGCGEDGPAAGPSSNTPVASIHIVPPPLDHNLHLGDTYQLRAQIEDADGNALNRDVTWFVHPNSVYPPPHASVSAHGRLTVESPLIFSLDIEAHVDDLSDQEHMLFRGWSFEEGVDVATGVEYGRAHLVANFGPPSPPRLYIDCLGDEVDLYVAATFPFASDVVRYRLDDGEERVEQWLESGALAALVYPEDPSALVLDLALVDTLVFAIQAVGGEEVSTFIPKGLGRFVESLVPPCGPSP